MKGYGYGMILLRSRKARGMWGQLWGFMRVFNIVLTTHRRRWCVGGHRLAGRLFLTCSKQTREKLQRIYSRPKGCDVFDGVLAFRRAWARTQWRVVGGSSILTNHYLVSTLVKHSTNTVSNLQSNHFVFFLLRVFVRARPEVLYFSRSPSTPLNKNTSSVWSCRLEWARHEQGWNILITITHDCGEHDQDRTWL